MNVPNPGIESSRLAPHPFEIKPSQPILKPDHKPDELMIEWGKVPHGSNATIYLPQVAAEKTLKWANQMYTTHHLTKVDPHTIQCKTGGVTYIPVPQGAVAAFVGLITLELPAGIHKGQEFAVVVRQITSETARRKPVVEIAKKLTKRETGFTATQGAELIAWRRSSGIFRITIPVSTKGALLAGEEKFLSIMRWNLESTPVSSRWYPVLKRYVDQIAGRVQGMGGDPKKVISTGDGNWSGGGRSKDFEPRFKGKILGLLYNHFGDFDGFVLEREDCDTHRICSRERKIEAVVRQAWLDRCTVLVVVHRDNPCCLVSLFVGGNPSACLE